MDTPVGTRGEEDAAIAGTLREALGDSVVAYRFGSTAGDFSRADSDVDIAVLATSRLEPLRRYELQERLASSLRRSVDLVDLRSASTILAMQVVANGRVVHDGDPDARGRFEDLVFTTYARLADERRPILDRIAEEGTVLGR